VTGSSFCSLAPLWQQKLDKAVLSAEQCSARGGHVSLTCFEDSVQIAGTTFHYMQGVIRLPLAER
jgi:predicted PhzF superfamily epimerase YddE/YHI9